MSRLKDFRKKSKMTQKELASKIGISHARISQIERDGFKNINTAKNFAKALPGLNWKDLLDESDGSDRSDESGE